MVGFINGIAMGAGVVIARYYGAKNREDLQKAIHTTVALIKPTIRKIRLPEELTAASALLPRKFPTISECRK